MDPYGEQNRKIFSPLDKKREEESKPKAQSVVEENLGEATVETHKDEEVQSENPETLVDHLTDLRKQFIKSIAVFLLFFILVFATIHLWFPYVTRGHELIILGPLEVVKFYMSIATALSFGLSLPFICHFIWQFIKPGLREKESQFFSLYSPVMLFLFLAGIAFGYFVVNPISYQFLTSLGAINFTVMVSAQEYMSFLLMTTVPLGLIFELPMVTMFLAATGLLTAHTLKNVRRWSYLVLAIVSALITPPDFVSQLIVLIPMILLYEASVLIVRRTEQRNIATSSKS